MSRPFRFGATMGQAPSSAAWTATARRLEELGFSTLLVPDRISQTLSPIPAMAAAAAATTTLRVCPFVLVPTLRNPVVLARECATLDWLSDGRLEVGFGTGQFEDDHRQAGIAFGPIRERVQRLRETLQVVGPLLRGEEITYHGALVTAERAAPFPPPVQRPRPPVLVAAGGRSTVAVAAAEADIVSIGTRELDHGALDTRIAWLRGAAGDRFTHLELGINLMLALPDGPEPSPRVAERVRRVFGFEVDEVRRLDSPYVLTGTPDAMCERLQRLRERTGVSYITMGADAMEQMAPVVARLAGA